MYLFRIYNCNKETALFQHVQTSINRKHRHVFNEMTEVIDNTLSDYENIIVIREFDIDISQTHTRVNWNTFAIFSAR